MLITLSFVCAINNLWPLGGKMKSGKDFKGKFTQLILKQN